MGTAFLKSTTYIGGIYELREETDLPPSHVFYISGESGVVAQVTRTGFDVGALDGTKIDYLHSDHLGSVGFSTNATGAASAKVKYDPYGNRFNPAGPPRLDSTMPPGLGNVRLGFTEHEMEVDDLGLINMRGRMFDPLNARFLSPDPLVASLSSQSWNRYMYVEGRPLNLTDPSGFEAAVVSNGYPTRDQNYRDLYGYSLGDIDGRMEAQSALADEVANMIIPGESGDAAIFNAGKAWLQSGHTNGVPISSGLNAKGVASSASYFAPSGTLMTMSERTGEFSKMVVTHWQDLLSFTPAAPPSPGSLWGSWRGPTSPGIRESDWRPGSSGPNVLKMFRDWVLGEGPNNYSFGHTSRHTLNMMDAPGVQAARLQFLKKNNGLTDPNRQPLTMFRAGFGLSGLIGAGLDPTEQFVGNYRIDIFPTHSGIVDVTLTNKTSFTSFAYGIGPSWQRGSWNLPGGNVTQTYSWSEFLE